MKIIKMNVRLTIPDIMFIRECKLTPQRIEVKESGRKQKQTQQIQLKGKKLNTDNHAMQVNKSKKEN